MSNRHDMIEKNVGLMIVLIILVVAVGGLVEIVPLLFPEIDDRAGGGIEAVHGAAAGRAATSTSAKAASAATRR